MARPLGRGDKGLAIKERRTIFGIPFFILFPFENINYFTLDNLSKYIWTYHVKVFVLGRKKNVQIASGYVMKNSYYNLARGRGKAFMTGPLRK